LALYGSHKGTFPLPVLQHSPDHIRGPLPCNQGSDLQPWLCPQAFSVILFRDSAWVWATAAEATHTELGAHSSISTALIMGTFKCVLSPGSYVTPCPPFILVLLLSIPSVNPHISP
jgi:hypothetical protein